MRSKESKEADGFIHLINSGAACLDANGESKDADGNNVMKAWYDVTEEDQDAMLKATTWNAADNGYFRGGGFSSRFLTQAEMPATMIRLNLVKGLGPVLQIAEGWTLNLPDEVSDKLGREQITHGHVHGLHQDVQEKVHSRQLTM